MKTATAKNVNAPKPAAKSAPVTTPAKAEKPVAKPVGAVKPDLIDAKRVEKTAPAAKKVEKKVATPKVYTTAASLIAGAKVVKEGSIGAAIFGVVNGAPEVKANVLQISEKLTEMDGEASLGIKAKDWVAGGDKRVGYVAGYVAWLVGNGNLVSC